MDNMKSYRRKLSLSMLLILSVVLAMIASPSLACEGSKPVKLKLHQSRFSLSLWDHAKDAMNAVVITLPIGCSLYNEIKVGDNLISDSFRAGSFWIEGSIGDWNLTVIEK